MEIGVFTNKMTTAPQMPEYDPNSNQAPLARELFSRLLKTVPGHDATAIDKQMNSTNTTTLYPSLPSAMESRLVAETVFSLAAIGGHDNPPARLIVGFEGIASVKEKLKTISEELEDFYEVSEQVDLPRERDGSKTEDDNKGDSKKAGSEQEGDDKLDADEQGDLDFDLDQE